MTLAEYHKLQEARQVAVSHNRVAAWRPDLKPVPVPACPPRPMAWQATDSNGDYIGSWPAATDRQDVVDSLSAAGYVGYKLSQVPAMR